MSKKRSARSSPIVDIKKPTPNTILDPMPVPSTGIYVRVYVKPHLTALAVYAVAYSGTTAPTPDTPLDRDPDDEEFYEGYIYAPCGIFIPQRFHIKVLGLFYNGDTEPPIPADDVDGPYWGYCMDRARKP